MTNHSECPSDCTKSSKNAVTKVIPGVPESITRDAYIELFKAAGLQPWNTKTLTFRADGIYAEIFARDENDVKIVDPIEGMVKHTIYIPVED